MRDGVVVKGVQFRDHRVVGDILELAARYRDEGADELVFYDITASPDGRTVDRSWVNRIAAVLDIPFCVAGGIRSVDDARAVLNLGADKISINSPALERPELIDELVRRFGSQCVVIGVDTLDARRRLPRLSVHRRSRAARSSRRAPHARLGARGAGARRRRDRAELHESGRRAQRLRPRAARQGARGVRRCR